MTQLSDTRYEHLLQPIRDLASNWSVDIATELESYLEVLEGVQFSFADGQAMNFAEAALLIQGSACIYSKKVEYLHTLVYQALEFIAERRKRDTRAGKEGEDGEGGSGAGGDDEDNEFEDEEQFLSLDDILEEGTGIDLDEGAVVAMPVALRPPATLLALEDTGNSTGDGDVGNYRIASCAVHRSGALLLEQRDGAALGDDLQPVSSEVGGGAQPAGGYWGGAAAAAAAATAGGGQPDQAMPDYDGAELEGGGGFSDDDADYGGGGFDDDGYLGGGPLDPDSNDAAAAGGAAHERRSGRQHGPGEGEKEAEEFDPYKPLDPNSRGSLKAKPFKKASKVARRPKARAAARRPLPTLDVLALALQAAALPAGQQGLLFPEFAYALKQQQEPGGKPSHGGSRAPSQRSVQTTAAAFTLEEAVAGFANEAEDSDDGGDFFDAGGAGFDDDDHYGPLGDFALPEGGLAPAAAAAAMDADWVGGMAMPEAGLDAADPDELTYEELCRAHIEAFINAAAAAEVQTELAARVAGWRSKMAPALEEEDARPEFDIHAYGERILERMAGLTCADEAGPEAAKSGELPPVTFGQLVGVGPKYEASRTFSSMLQLINNGNVRIIKLGASGQGGQEGQGFTLTLLDRVLPHKRVADYRALGGAGAPAAAAAEAQAKAAAGAAEVGEGEEEDLGENQHGRANKPAAAAAGGKAGAKKGSSGGSRAAGKGAAAAKAGGGRAKRQKG